MRLQSYSDNSSVHNIFVGRTAERSRLARFSEKVLDGQSWAVLLEGGAGVGKTALLRRGAPSPATFCVLHATCVPGEAALPFGLVSQLLWRARSHITSAAAIANWLTASETPARVGARLLEILDAAQVSRPLAVIIDDLQWADPESAEAFGYVMRMLEAARVLTLLSARTRDRVQGEWTAGLSGYWRRLVDDRQFGHRIHLYGLTPEQVAELAAALGHETIPFTTAERLRRHTDGNPGSLRALLTEVPPHSLAQADRPFPVPGSVAAQVGRLLTKLPPASLSLLDALAVLDTKCPLGLAGRVAGVADPVAALEPLLGVDIALWWPEDPATPIRVRLPMQRDAIYQMLTPGRRRDLHLAAAAVVHGEARWAHRVAAVAGVDDGLACELELTAARELRAGSAKSAATMLLWAADLSEDRGAYERRLLVAVAQAAARVALAVARGYMVPGAGLVDTIARQVDTIARQVLAIDGIDGETRTMAECTEAEVAARRDGEDAALRALESASIGSILSSGPARPGDAIVLWRRGALR